MTEQQLQREHAERVSAALASSAGAEGFQPRAVQRGTILSSWRRCASQVGLDPFRPRHPDVLEGRDIEELRARLSDLIDLAAGDLRGLHRSLACSGFALVLTDNRGRIIDHLTQDSVAKDFQRAGLWLGADWGESTVGTNGIGTCIAEGRAVTVHKDEHFLRQNIHLTCSAAPIREARGGLIGVLDASCCTSDDSRESQTFLRLLVENAARTIENRLFLRELQGSRVLRFHDRPEGVSPHEALLAIGDDDRVLAVNQATLDLLGAESRAELIGQESRSLFGRGLDELLLRAVGGDTSVRRFTDQRTGHAFHGFVHRQPPPPRRARGMTVPPNPRDPDACRGELCTLATLAGGDPRMRQAAERARRVMDKDIPILLHGETGTGKELFAHAIHLASQRKDGPFVALNCAAIPETLIESELFGYRGGAFTGARREGARGKIIESHGGTLFLDEIGDMPPSLQSRLLRVLETREVLPLGAERAVPVDLHVITATHRDLPSQVAAGEFRDDLYYRINGITLPLVPLRERADLEEIVLKVLEAENDTGAPLTLAPDALAALLAYHWPGNLRQLRYAVRTAVALSEGGVLTREHLNLPTPRLAAVAPTGEQPTPRPAGPASPDAPETPGNPLRNAEHQVIVSILAAHNGNVSRTAEALDMSRNTLYRKMRKYGLLQKPG